MTKVIRAVDIGYGNTKFVVNHVKGMAIQCSMFPSVAPLSRGDDGPLSDITPKRNSVTVFDGAGNKREVGKEAALLGDGSSVTNMDDNFTESPEYLAFFRGVLHYMNQDRIDMMVTGLPVSIFTIPGAKQKLEERLAGVHEMPNGRKIRVDKVTAVPQPYGGFFDYSVTNEKFEQMKSQTNLIVDPGYRTFDWLVMQGMKIMPNLSFAHPKSMGAIVESIAEGLGKQMKANLANSLQSLSRIDESLRTGKPPVIRGQERNLNDFLPLAKAVAEESLTAMSKKIGEANDIDNIIVCGGGAKFFFDLIKERYPDQNVVMSPNSVFSNVRGFQIAGELWLDKTPARAAA